MKRLLRLTIQDHPIPQLLFLEWILMGGLLVLSLARSFFPYHWFFNAVGEAFSVFFILLFTGMGLYLPLKKSTASKVVFTSLEIGLIILALLHGWIRGLVLPYLVFFIRSCILFNLLGQLVVVPIVAIFLVLSWLLLYKEFKLMKPEMIRDIVPSFGMVFFVMYFLSLFFVLIMINSLMRERQIRAELVEANQKLQQYSLLIQEQSKFRERNRIARDIHDSLGHSLTGISLQLEAAQKLWQVNPETSFRLIKEAKEMVSRSLQDIRQVIRELRVTSSLEDNLKKLLQEIKKWSDANVKLDFQSHIFIPPQIQKETFRIVQEAVNNVVKHAEATEIQIRVETSNIFFLKIEDNGRGFQVEEEHPGFGLKGIRERSKALGGICEIHSTPGEGTTIQVTIPLLEDKP
jgi:signal transduction histidine kinase